MLIRIAGTVSESIVDGPGIRYTIFTQGCPHHCEGCHNPETHDFSGGRLADTDKIYNHIAENPLLKGITFSGGEPFCQPAPLYDLAKRIKENTVLDNVSYTFKSGFVYGLYGQNGSGKTMLLRAISGLINLDSGSIFIDGEKLHDKIEFPPETGIVIENMELLPECSAKRNLQMLAKIKNIADEKDIIFSLERVGLDPDSEKKVKKFSLGMKQRLNIAQAIFENQKIILLDEPTNALDEDAVQLIYKIIREEKSRGATIIVATHHKEDLKEVCDVILKIAGGKIVEENENK